MTRLRFQQTTTPVMIAAARGEPHFEDVLDVLTDDAVKALCRDAQGTQVVSHKYVQGGKRRVQFVALVYTRISESSRTRRGAVNPAGFLVATPGKTPDDLYIDVVCGAGHGKALVKEALRFARARGYRTASLSALPHVVDFYPQFRFMAGDADPCAPGASAQRVAAAGGSATSGYRFRKCLEGTTEANNHVPRGPDQDRYRLPPLSPSRTRTVDTLRGATRVIDLTSPSPSPSARARPSPSSRPSPSPSSRPSPVVVDLTMSPTPPPRHRAWDVDLTT